MKIFLRIIKIFLNRLLLKNIDSTVHFTGKKYIKIGNNTLISQNTWLNVNKRSRDKHIIIGDYCFIGRNNFFTSGEIINFENYVITSVNCCFIGADHDIGNPSIPYYFAETRCDRTINVGFNVFIGANTTLIGNVFIGHGSVIGANTFIKNCEFPPFSIIVGNPGHIIKRFSFIENCWKKVDSWTNDDEKSIIPLNKYRDIIMKKNYEDNIPYKAIGKTNGNLYL
jgi:acetyltransferase-like isoleucine patch superfamily enzyme